jgi:anti-sigma regulatory factor (Ser/Thr protein kinase)
MMVNACFHFRTLDEVRSIASFVANSFPKPEATAYGLSELLINAVEHGNLGIGYEKKTELLLSNTWQEEVESRLMLQENKKKYGTLTFEYLEKSINICIKDQGKGFDSRPFMELSPERCVETHGRGIALAKMISFDTLEYIGCGNEVKCSVTLPG